MKTEPTYRGWEYARIGDFHRDLDPTWSYTPTYLGKMRRVRLFIESLPQNAQILDAGCGEGILVEEFRKKGRRIEGLDYNYESEFVRRGDVRCLPYPDQVFDAIINTDVFEHLPYEDQPKCLAEFKRVLKPGGRMLISVPNLAHLNSRVKFFLRGMLDRTDVETNHVGERPLKENAALFREAGFEITEVQGITLTLPWVYRRLICRHAARLRWMHDLMEPLARMFPSLSMLSVFICSHLEKTPPKSLISQKARHAIIEAAGYAKIFSLNTHMTVMERICLYDLARMLPEKSTVVEIGSYVGASTCFLAAGVRAFNGKIMAIGPWSNFGMTEGLRDTYDEFLTNTEPLRDWIIPLRGMAIQTSMHFDNPIDLLFVDGDHSYEAVCADLAMWLPKVKDGGIVVCHDYCWSEGVRQAVREIVVPRQTGGARHIDSLYWAHVGQRKWIPTLAVSVIMPTCGRSEYLRETIESLIKQEYSADQCEILIVDNNPTGEVRRIVEDYISKTQFQLRYIEEPALGLHNGRHAGARHANGEILIFVDDDVIVPSGWLGAMREAFSDNKVAMVGGKTVPRWEGFAPPLWIEEFGPNGGTYLSILNSGDSPIIDGQAEAYGCNLAIRRGVLFEVGGFNPDGISDRRKIWLRGDGESTLKERVHAAGYKIVYSPKAWLYHRIPHQRVTPKYFCWRGFMQGISDSFTHARFYHLTPLGSLRHSVRCLINCLKHSYSAPFSIRKRVACHYWWGRAQHQLRLALSSALRAHVYRDTYL